MAGRSIVMSHRGTTVTVKEGQDDRCVLVIESHRQNTDKKFPAACREALTYLLANAGQMKGDYER